jgi:hypothetical protein
MVGPGNWRQAEILRPAHHRAEQVRGRGSRPDAGLLQPEQFGPWLSGEIGKDALLPVHEDMLKM